ncbi:MAG: AsmA family protein [Gammaproteobacteria bacterium]|nr:AsmA family protein [Gammaproteobacteria bacterium]
MRKFLKILLWLVGGVGVVLLALVALLFFVDVDHFRPQIERQVSSALGREVLLEGPLTLEPSLTPRFAVAGLKIANPAWASRPHLASVDKFDIRVSLLPLLDRRLEIVSLEFHGVDLQLELTEEGVNNFTFPESDGSGPVPAIERMSLHDAKVAYLVPGLPLRSVNLAHATARKVPGEPIELDAQTTINTVPLKLSLRAEALEKIPAQGSWKTTLVGEIGNLSLRLVGRVGDPGDWDHGRYQVHLEGPNVNDLETLSGLNLPEMESYALDAKVGFDFDDYVKVDEFTASIGNSDLRGSINWNIDAPRPAIKIRLKSRQLDIDDMGLDEPSPETETPQRGPQSLDEFLDQPLDPTFFAAVDLDIQVQVGRLEGLAEPVQDIAFSLYANDKNIRLASSTATLMDARVEAQAKLPWGKRIEALEPVGLRVRTLLKHAELDFRAGGGAARTVYSEPLMDRPLALTLSSLEASVRPGAPVSIRAEAAINEIPVSMSLTGESLAELVQQSSGPWQGLVFELRGDAIQIDASGSVARPLEAQGFDIGYALSGDDLYALLPLRGTYSLSGRYRDQPGSHLIEDLKVRLGASDLSGRIVVHQNDTGPSVLARLESNRLQLDQLLPAEAQGSGPADMDQPLNIARLGDIALDVEIRADRVDGLDLEVHDVLLVARSRGQDLSLEPFRATVDGTPIDASAKLPWGRRLARLDRRGLSVSRLIGHTDLRLQASLPEGKVRYQTEMLEQNFTLELIGLDASARPGEPLKITAKAELGDKPMDINLQAERLADLLARPTGPWRDLAMEFHVGDISFKAGGSVEHPLEGSGFDIGFQLKGAEIDALLPLFDLILPLEGAYSLKGHFADQADKIFVDDLEINSGRSDISGEVTLYHRRKRPRVEAALYSDQIYLRELVPVSQTETASNSRKRLIPDYELPIDAMQALDGEIVFKGKRLRTDAGDLGDLKFRAELQDGMFRLAPFRVHGWAGGLIEADIKIDASQNAPVIDMQLTSLDFDYGLLLRQAGMAEVAEGLLNINLQLSGNGRTRREFLADAKGQLVIVGKDGRIASRGLDLWGAGLLTTMLSRSWRADNVTTLNCLVARVDIEDGIARSDTLLMDTQRITVGASGALDLESEELNFIFAPRPKRASLISLTNPVSVTGTLADPQVSVTVLPRNRTAAAGVGALAGLINPGYLIFAWTHTGWGEANPCLSAVEEARKMKGLPEPLEILKEEPPADFSPLAGCSVLRR